MPALINAAALGTVVNLHRWLSPTAHALDLESSGDEKIAAVRGTRDDEPTLCLWESALCYVDMGILDADR
jgi:hypothetical protein